MLGIVGRTSDVMLDGELWDFKRIESGNKQKIFERIIGKVGKQGPNFVLDLSVSSIPLESAFAESAALLEYDGVEQIIIIKDRRAWLLRK